MFIAASIEVLVGNPDDRLPNPCYPSGCIQSVDWTSGLDYWTGNLITKILYTSVSSFLMPWVTWNTGDWEGEAF